MDSEKASACQGEWPPSLRYIDINVINLLLVTLLCSLPFAPPTEKVNGSFITVIQLYILPDPWLLYFFVKRKLISIHLIKGVFVHFFSCMVFRCQDNQVIWQFYFRKFICILALVLNEINMQEIRQKKDFWHYMHVCIYDFNFGFWCYKQFLQTHLTSY